MGKIKLSRLLLSVPLKGLGGALRAAQEGLAHCGPKDKGGAVAALQGHLERFELCNIMELF